MLLLLLLLLLLVLVLVLVLLLREEWECDYVHRPVSQTHWLFIAEGLKLGLK